jgi:hypothetical protein
MFLSRSEGAALAMRIGVLEFGSVLWASGPVLDPLRARDIDVIPGDSVIASLGDALREAKRLSRADCDGVLLVVGDGLLPRTCPPPRPCLPGSRCFSRATTPCPAYFDAVGALEAIGARFDRVYPVNGEPDLAVYLQKWLEENGKKQRHRGLEARENCTGQRLFVSSETGGLPDTPSGCTSSASSRQPIRRAWISPPPTATPAGR